MGLAILILGLIVFLATHLFVTMREARAAAIAKLGLNTYRVLFSIVSLGSLALIVWGFAQYRAHEWIQVWSPPGFMRHVALALMLPASIVLVAYFIPSRIKAWTKHPQLLAVKIWALAHLLANGDLAAILMFGVILGWAVYARIAAKKRGDMGFTTPPAGWTNDVIVVVIGIVVYLALGYAFHPAVIGVPVFGR
jgi:uncharacterized membrane protein